MMLAFYFNVESKAKRLLLFCTSVPGTGAPSVCFILFRKDSFTNKKNYTPWYTLVKMNILFCPLEFSRMWRNWRERMAGWLEEAIKKNNSANVDLK